MVVVDSSVRSEKTAAAEPRERLLSAAGREFAERGYEAATVRDICLAAGVNLAAVNYYFGDSRLEIAIAFISEFSFEISNWLS
jgi:AcrR family transcriptional regulator